MVLKNNEQSLKLEKLIRFYHWEASGSSGNNVTDIICVMPSGRIFKADLVNKVFSIDDIIIKGGMYLVLTAQTKYLEQKNMEVIDKEKEIENYIDNLKI